MDHVGLQLPDQAADGADRDRVGRMERVASHVDHVQHRPGRSQPAPSLDVHQGSRTAGDATAKGKGDVMFDSRGPRHHVNEVAYRAAPHRLQDMEDANRGRAGQKEGAR